MKSASVVNLRRPSPIGSSPTRLRLADLLRITDEGADDALHGRFDHLLPAGGLPAEERWAARIHGDDELDVWLVSWAPHQSTGLHDHGGSLGALTVLSGSLNEFRWNGRELALRRLDAGDQAGFPLGWVHDVAHARSRPPAPAAATTLSVHAYSPPLTAKSYYDVTPANTLRRSRTVLA